MGKPGPKCTICHSPHRAAIDIGLTSGMSAKALADRFGLGDDAILRHSQNHLTIAQRAAILVAQNPSVVDLDALRTSESEGLLANVTVQRARLHSLGELALEQEDVRAAVSVEAAVTANLQLTAKLLGQLISVHDHRHSSLLLTPDYLKLREVLVTTLQAHPVAARDVAAAPHKLESDAAQDITQRAARPSKPAPAAPVMIEHEPPLRNGDLIPPPPPPPRPPC